MTEKVDQIVEMALDIMKASSLPLELSGAIATDLYNKGYRKVDEDYAIQCTCYALGCQMAEKIKEKVIAEFKALVKQDLIDKGLYLAITKNALDKAEKEVLKGE